MQRNAPVPLVALVLLSGCAPALTARERAAERAWLKYRQIAGSQGSEDHYLAVEKAQREVQGYGRGAVRPVGRRLVSPDTDLSERCDAAILLYCLRDRRGLPYLRKALAIDGCDLAHFVSRAIRVLRPDEEAVPPLFRALRRDMDEIWPPFEKAYGYARLGDAEKEAYEEVEWAAAITYAIAACARPSHRGLARLLKDPDPRVRLVGVFIITRGQQEYYPHKLNDYWPLVPRLIEMLGQSDLPKARRWEYAKFRFPTPEEQIERVDGRCPVLDLLQVVTANPRIAANGGWEACQKRWRAWYAGVKGMSRPERVRHIWRESFGWTPEERRRVGEDDAVLSLAIALGDDPDKWVVGEIVRHLGDIGSSGSLFYSQEAARVLIQRLTRWTGQPVAWTRQGMQFGEPEGMSVDQLQAWWKRNQKHLHWDTEAQRLVDTRCCAMPGATR